MTEGDCDAIRQGDDPLRHVQVAVDALGKLAHSLAECGLPHREVEATVWNARCELAALTDLIWVYETEGALDYLKGRRDELMAGVKGV